MKLITTQSLTREVAKTWRAAYPIGAHLWGTDKDAVGDKLEKLDPETVTAEQVNAIIGNATWTTPPSCGECEVHDGRPVVELGDEPDYETRTTWVCRECMVKALALFDGVRL